MKYLIIQGLLFLLGLILFFVDGSGGYTENMTSISYIGLILMFTGLALQLIVGGLVWAFKKIFK